MKKRIFALLLSIAVIFSCFSCITVFADSTGLDSATEEAIRTAFKAYVDEKGNNTDPDALLAYINTAIAPATVEYDTDGIFIRHAVDGVKDEGDDGYPVDIKGHVGAVAVNLKVYNSDSVLVANLGDMATIPFKTENLGTLTYDIFDTAAYNEAKAGTGKFTIDASGNLTNYTGTAQKIIITDDYLETAGLTSVNIKFPTDSTANTNKDNVIAVVIGGSNVASMNVNIGGAASTIRPFSYWDKLRAVELPRKIVGYIGNGAFAYNAELKYADTPATISNTSGGYGVYYNLGFYKCEKLENINSNNTYGRMTMGQLWESIYKYTAVRDFYFEGSYQYGSSGSAATITANPTYTEGTQVVLEKRNGTIPFTFTMAAAFAQEKASSLEIVVNSENAQEVLNTITSAYSARLADVTAAWADDTYKNVLLTYGDYTIPVKYTFAPKAEVPEGLLESIGAAFDAYVDEKGNNTEPDALLAYINEAIAPASVAYDTDGIFIRHAVDGVYDEPIDEISAAYPIDIKGHTGAVSVNFKVYNSDEELVAYHGDMAVIPFETENLGELTYDIFDYDAYIDAVDEIGVFKLDENGNLTDYTGNAQKVIITDEYLEDAGLTSVNIQFPTDNGTTKTNKDNVIAVVIGGSDVASMNVNIGKTSSSTNRPFSYWDSLRAVELPRVIVGSVGIGTGAFAYNPELKYADTPASIVTAAGGFGTYQNLGFYKCEKLENINSNNTYTRMTTGQLWESIYKYTAVRDFYFEGAYQYGSSGSAATITANPTYTEGTQVVLEKRNGTIPFTFTMAAAFAQEKASAYGAVTAENATEALAAVESSYSSRITGVEAAWADDTYSTVILSYGEYSIPVAFVEVSYNTDIELTMDANADFRTTAPAGVRFSYTVAGLADLEADETVSSVELGTVIIADSSDITGITHVALNSASSTYLDIPTVYTVDNTVTAVLSNIKAANLTRTFSARGYAKITYTDNAVKYVYAANIATVVPAALAETVLADDNATAEEKAFAESINSVVGENAQNWIDTQYGNSDAAAFAMRDEILATQSGEVTGYTNEWLVNEENFADFDFSNIPESTKVLFERGGTYRVGSIVLKNNNIYFGAYGTESAKPNVYGSVKNFADSTWTQSATNVWYVEDITEFENNDAGIVIFDDGKAAGTKKAELAEVTVEGDFWYDQTNDRVYLYSTVDPSTAWESIEIGVDSHIFEIEDNNNITIDNLNIRYGGAHGISLCNVADITITNCEIAYIGGSYMTNTSTPTTRYGNGVELWLSGTNVTVDNCWIHQIYDAGLTHQGTATINSGNGLFAQENITFSNNLVEYCGLAAIEYWASSSGSGTQYNTFKNINYTDNILRFAGYGIGNMNGDRRGSIITTSYDCLNYVIKVDSKQTFYITNNILDTATGSLLNTAACNYHSATPILSGNTYMQTAGATFGNKSGGFVDGSATTVTTYLIDENIASTISSTFGDKTATVVVY